jgi:hypothetical protein
MLSNNYGNKIQNGYQGVSEDLVHYVRIHDRTPALEQHMEHLTVFNITHNMSQPGSSCSANINRTTKFAVWIMDSMKGDTAGTAGMANADHQTCHNCYQVVSYLAQLPKIDLD